MLRNVKGSRWVLVVVGLLVAGLLMAREFVTSSPGPPYGDAPTVPAEEAGAHVGETARVCGRVAGASYVPGVKGRPTFLNLGSSYPEPEFTAVIWGEFRERFEVPPEDLFDRRRICVTGRVDRHEETPQIEVRSPEQIEVGAPEKTGRKRRPGRESGEGG